MKCPHCGHEFEPPKSIAEQIVELKKAKTQAERARAYRERKKAKL